MASSFKDDELPAKAETVFNPDNYFLTEGTLNATSSFRKYNNKKLEKKIETHKSAQKAPMSIIEATTNFYDN